MKNSLRHGATRPTLRLRCVRCGCLTPSQLLNWLGARSGAALNVAWIFALTAALGTLIAQRFAVRYTQLIAGLAVIVAWIAVWDKILGHPNAAKIRNLLIAAGLVLILGAVVLTVRRRRSAAELITAGGLALVAAGTFGIVGVAVQLLGRAPGLSALVSGVALPHQSFGWDLMLLIVALGLILYGAYVGSRGPGYVGALSLLLFVVSVGTQITELAGGNPPSHSIVGWPLALIALGALGLGGPAASRLRRIT